jgi:rhodanese-related sulfurtransferase
VVRLLILVATAASLLLGACGSDVDHAPGTPIAAADLAERIQAGSAPLILDVRTRDEFAQGHVPGAINIPHDELPSRLSELPIERSEELVVHCRSGRRAQLAAETLREGGYTDVRDLTGHWLEWQAAGLPAE